MTVRLLLRSRKNQSGRSVVCRTMFLCHVLRGQRVADAGCAALKGGANRAGCAGAPHPSSTIKNPERVS